MNQDFDSRSRYPEIIGQSHLIQEVFRLIDKVSPLVCNVLIQGESGTGKELVANAIHYNSLRSEKAFVKVNCAALPETLIESELFGHEKGAFTGAMERRNGKFEHAHKGTMFLDEIGTLSLAAQGKIPRALKEK